MKKFSVLIALVLLAVAGTCYAVTCSYDNVPAATLLVPYWKVSLNGLTADGVIPTGGTDTLVSIINVSTPGVIAHVTVWNKYSKPVIDFNVPLTGKDIVAFSMRDIMNGALSPNLPQSDTTKYPVDPCGLVNPGKATATYKPSVGFGQTQFIRFSHPEAATFNAGCPTCDINRSISQYNLTSADAIGPLFRPIVWDSLDESGDVTNWAAPGTTSAGNILDVDNPQCSWNSGATDSTYKGALSGYLTIDVVNYCTNYFPDQKEFYNEDAIATLGWGPTYTPNVLTGDVFFVDTATAGGNISGDPAVALEFDSRLGGTANKTFFGKFVTSFATSACANEATVGCSTAPAAPAIWQFGGDGREPLGDHYAFRYVADAAAGLQSFAIVWRSDLYQGTTPYLCAWADPGSTKNKGASGSGFYDALHQVAVLAFDLDENLFGGVGVPPGPSGLPPGTTTNTYIFLESQRISLSATADWNPAGFKGGWVDLTLRGATLTGADAAHGFYNMGWVGVQHTAPGAFISVGHAAANLDNQFQCLPNRLAIGTQVGGTSSFGGGL